MFSDKPFKRCPECGGAVEQLISASSVQFKGSGWYATDYPKKGSSAPSSSSSSSESDSSSKETSEAKDSKETKKKEDKPKSDTSSKKNKKD
jgi:hypothetical protein